MLCNDRRDKWNNHQILTYFTNSDTHTVTPDAMLMFVMILMAMMLIVITKIPQKKVHCTLTYRFIKFWFNGWHTNFSNKKIKLYDFSPCHNGIISLNNTHDPIWCIQGESVFKRKFENSKNGTHQITISTALLFSWSFFLLENGLHPKSEILCQENCLDQIEELYLIFIFIFFKKIAKLWTKCPSSDCALMTIGKVNLKFWSFVNI